MGGAARCPGSVEVEEPVRHSSGGHGAGGAGAPAGMVRENFA